MNINTWYKFSCEAYLGHLNVILVDAVCQSVLCWHSVTSQHPILGYNRPTSETPSEWRFAGGPIVTRLYVLTWGAEDDGNSSETQLTIRCNKVIKHNTGMP